MSEDHARDTFSRIESSMESRPSVDYNLNDNYNEELLEHGKKALETMTAESGKLSDNEDGENSSSKETTNLEKVF